jgi:hypothetical protein
MTTTYMDFQYFAAGKKAGDNCSTILDMDCSPQLYCNPLTLKCTDKVKFSPSCPASCNFSNECYEGTCFNGTCARSAYKRNIGENCTAWVECFSGVCTNGKCAGVDCTNFNCTNLNYHCELILNSTGSSPVCVPDFFTFNCNYSSNYPVRVNVQTVQCVPKKAANSLCSNDYECVSNWCYPSGNGTCMSYSWNSIPVGRDCFAGFCAPGLYCNTNYTCAAYRLEGDLCNNTSQCLADLQCVQNGTQLRCQRSSTIGKTCGWNSLGEHNCTVSFGESCVCFGSSTPRCVSVNSEEYLGRIQQSRQLITSSLGNVQLLNNATLKASVCQLASLNLDTNYASTLPSIISGSYLKNKTSCNFANLVPTLDDSTCRSQYAKYLCCSLCSGLLDAYLSEYPSLNRDDKIFSGLYLGPIYTLTCGANPIITVNKDTCNGANVLSYNEIVNQLQCASSYQPSYGLLAFNISAYNPSNLTQNYLQTLILNFISSLGLPQPSVVSVTERSDNPFLNYVMIGYTGASNTQQTLSSLSNSFSGSNFTNYLVQYNIAAASISAISIDTITAPLFPQPSSQPLPNNNQTSQPQPSSSEPLPNNLSPQPFPNNQSPQPSSQPLPNNLSPQPNQNQPSSEPLPSNPTQPFPNNLYPQPNLLVPTTPEPVTSPVTPTTPTSTPTQPPPNNNSPSFSSKSVVVSMIILIASMVIGLSF